jgi:hypothetical protein
MELFPGLLPESITMIVSRVSLSIVKAYLFLVAIRVSLAVHRVSPAAADYLAGAFGITRACQRARLRVLIDTARDRII